MMKPQTHHVIRHLLTQNAHSAINTGARSTATPDEVKNVEIASGALIDFLTGSDDRGFTAAGFAAVDVLTQGITQLRHISDIFEKGNGSKGSPAHRLILSLIGIAEQSMPAEILSEEVPPAKA